MKSSTFKSNLYILLIFLILLTDCSNNYSFEHFKDSKRYFSEPGNNKHLMQIEVFDCYKILSKESVISSFKNLPYTKNDLSEIRCFVLFNGKVIDEYVTPIAEQEILQRSLLNYDGSFNNCVDTSLRINRHLNDSSEFLLDIRRKDLIIGFDKICNNNKIDTFLILWAGNYSNKKGKAIRLIPESELYFGKIDTSKFKELRFYGIKDSCQ
jgi:hypothetical protein